MNYRMKPKKYNPAKHTVPKWAQQKMDGHRYYIDRDGVFSSHEHDITKKVRDQEWYGKMRSLVQGSGEIEFELCSPGFPAEHVPTALKLGLPLVAYCFGTNLVKPSVTMTELESFFLDAGLSTPQLMTTDGHVGHLLALAKARQYEGWVLKDGNYENWLKLKPVNEIDLVVTDIWPGKGKYEGFAGSLECSTTEGHILCNCSGMTDDVREQLSTDDIGRVVEVQYDRLGAKGRLRFPQFARWRDDKTPDDCPITQDPQVEEYYQHILPRL